MVDPRWLFEHDARLFDAFGQRMDVAGLPRWSNPDAPIVREANHAAVPPGAPLIPDQLVQVFDAQRREGAHRRCVDVYGDVDERDALCKELGLYEQPAGPVHVLLFERAGTPTPLPDASHHERTAPPVEQIHRREWVDAVDAVYHGEVPAWRREHVMAEATIADARFYAIRIGEAVACCVARYDWPGASRISSLYTDAAFRKTGFAAATLGHALHACPNRVAFGVIDGDSRGMVRVGRRVSAGVALTNPRRRYVGKWDD